MVVFRVDFGSKIGLGHLKRSLVYAKNFDEVVYVSKSDEKDLIPYPLYTIKNEEEFFEIVKNLQPKQVIVDNYEFTIEYQKKFKNLFPKIKLSCFDDEYKEYYCDEIINHNLGVNINRYKNPKIVKIIPPLIEIPKRKNYKKNGVFVAIGGVDNKGVILKLLKITKKKLNIYTTSKNKNLKKLKRLVKIYKHNLYIDKDIKKGMLKSEFGIITPSVLSYEALALNLDFIAIQTVDNQKEIAKYLKKKRIKVISYKRLYKLKGKI